MKQIITDTNYTATIVEIKNKIDLPGCDNICHTNIFGNMVIISKVTNVGDIGLYFPPECRLSETYLHENSMYRDKTFNKNQDKSGFFEKGGRIRCVKLRGHQSAGLFMPLSSLSYISLDKGLQINDSFNNLEIDSKVYEICKKYVVQARHSFHTQKQRKKAKESKIISSQWHFHYDTEQLGKNIYWFEPDDVIFISKKMHGSSFISGKVLCKRKLNPIEKFLKYIIGVAIKDVEYDIVYSSRKVIKNPDLNSKVTHYYDTDIWGFVNEEIKHTLTDGLTLYGEIVGFTPEGSPIQKDYDYGCINKEHHPYIYRITYTAPDGQVFDFDPLQVKQWCDNNGLKSVPMLYCGKVRDLFPDLDTHTHFQETLLEKLKEKYLEKDCDMCKNNVPDEGIVIRNLSEPHLNAFKLKSFRFLEKESKQLDKGEVSLEDQG